MNFTTATNVAAINRSEITGVASIASYTAKFLEYKKSDYEPLKPPKGANGVFSNEKPSGRYTSIS